MKSVSQPYLKNFCTFLFRRSLLSVCKRTIHKFGVCCALAKLTPQEVDVKLRSNEYSHEFDEGPVKSYDSNQLGSNVPIEDMRSEASCLMTSGLLIGVFDGHAGASCSQVVSKRLFEYISACLLPHDLLVQYFTSLNTSTQLELTKYYNNRVQFVDEIKALYQNSFAAFLEGLLKEGSKQNFEMKSALTKAFVQLDNDLSNEAHPRNGKFRNPKALSVAMSGTVACVAHIDGVNVHVAHVGDSAAVLGSLSDTNAWIAKRLTNDHNEYNQVEVDRIFSEHPHNEHGTIFRMGRLLGQLAPLRAFGDIRYKWSKQTLEQVANYLGEHIIPPNYLTPPYLSNIPDISYYRLTPRDKFLILATDGLWDIVSPLQVVRLVGEHMSGKVTLSPLVLPKNITLSEIHRKLLQRENGLKMKPKDRNAATHLIRNALGGNEHGMVDHSEISELLSLPDDVVRDFRDDITVTVAYFDSEFLRHSPP